VPNKKLLILSSILVVLLAIAIAIHFPTEYFSALGSLFGAVAGILAVIWFSASLYYQSQQMKEQRQQFLENFKQLREDNRRNSLVIVKDILSRAEERALKSNPNLKSINDLMAQYIIIIEWPDILKSKDPQIVLEAGKNWLTMKDNPAVFLMRGIKSAAEIYLRSIDNKNIDYTLEPELFVAAYGSTLWKVPYFAEYQGIASWISEWMVRMEPARKGIQLAYQVALLKDSPKYWKKDKIIKDIEQHKKAGYPMPAIAEDLMNNIE
jgi:hypothetical protein